MECVFLDDMKIHEIFKLLNTYLFFIDADLPVIYGNVNRMARVKTYGLDRVEFMKFAIAGGQGANILIAAVICIPGR
jgi:hypothetical protein